MVRLTLSQKAWIVFLFTAGIFIFVNLIFAFIGYTTTSPSECMNCHKDSYKLWKENRIHRNSISCTFCHSNRTSSQYAYIPEGLSNMPGEVVENCIKCHKNFMEEEKTATVVTAEILDNRNGRVIKKFGPWTLKEIKCREKFSCLVCHKNITHDRGSPGTNLPRANYCAECHYHRDKDPFCQVSPKPQLVFMKKGKKVVSPAIR